MSSLPVVVFDGDCSFCTSSARWLQHRARGRMRIEPWQHADLHTLGLSEQACRTSVQFVDGPTRASGAAAIAAALRQCSPPWPLVGAVIDWRPLRPVAERVYVLVADNRHRLPGGTAACALHDDERSPIGVRRDRPGDSVAPSLG